MIYLPKHFRLEEFVSPAVFHEYGERSWEFLDDRMVRTVDTLRDFFGVPLIINNWKTGGIRTYCGYREPSCPVGAKNSQHRMGRAVDIICSIPARDMRKKILDNPESFPYLTTLEDKVDWLHADTRSSMTEGIRLINP